VFERWRHIHGCARFFNAARDSVSDKFIVTYKAGEPKPDLTGRGPASSAKPKKTAGKAAN
jgi:sarcosine oxidase subunit delta